MAKTLVVFYSRAGENYFGGQFKTIEVGNTRIVADKIKNYTNAEVFEVLPVVPYSNSYKECVAEGKVHWQKHEHPALVSYPDPHTEFDNLIVCGPCWYGTFPMVLFSALDKLNLAGKKVYPLITHEGSGLKNAPRDLAEAYPEALLQEGLAVMGSAVHQCDDELTAWLQKNDLM